MLTLSATLLSAQKNVDKDIVFKVVLSRTSQTTRGYDLNRVLKISHIETPSGDNCEIVLSNHDGALSALDFEHYQAVISEGYKTGVTRSAWAVGTVYAIDDVVRPTTANGYQYRCAVAGTSHAVTEPTWPTSLGVTVADNTVTWEMDGNAGEEYARRSPLRVRVQELHSGRGLLKMILRPSGILDQLGEDTAKVKHTGLSTDTASVKTLFDAVCAGSTGVSSAFNGYTAITVVYDSGYDGGANLMNTAVPAEGFYIVENESRLNVLQKLLADYTDCKMRVENDGKIHIFRPTTAVVASTITLRPNGAGDEENIPNATSGAGLHHQDVDEVVADDNTSIVETNTEAGYVRDLYSLPDTIGYGTITSVTVYARARSYLVVGATLKICAKTNGTVYEGNVENLTDAYANYSKQWTTNPNTGNSWTWAEIKALQIGISLEGAGPIGYTGRCTQVYAEVAYNAVDYEFQFNVSGQHTFFNKSIRERFVEPNEIIVKTADGITPAYSGTATSATSYALSAKTRTERRKITSNQQGIDIATALIQTEELDAERGFITVPMDVGLELWDYVQVTDSREGDTRIGNVQYIRRDIDITGRIPTWSMQIAFGKVSATSLLANMMGSGDSADSARISNETLLKWWDFINDYIEKQQKSFTLWGDLQIETLDDVLDGVQYARVPFADFSSGHILLSSTIKDASNRTVTDAEKDIYVGKAKVFRQTTAPVSGMQTSDIWIDTTNNYDLPYTYNGSAWIASYTYISGGYIKTGTIDASLVTIQSVSGSNKIEINENYIAGYAGAALQFYLSAADGKAYAGAGAIYLDSTGVNIKGEYLFLRDTNGNQIGTLYGDATNGAVIAAVTDKKIRLSTGGSGFVDLVGSLLPNATNTYDLGSSSLMFDDGYITNLQNLSIANKAGAGTTIAFGPASASAYFNPTTSAYGELGLAAQYWFACHIDNIYYKDLFTFDDYPDVELVKAIKSKGDTIDKATLPAKVKHIPDQKDFDYVTKWNTKLVEDHAKGKRLNESPLGAPEEFVSANGINGLLLGTMKELIDRIEKIEAKLP